MLMSYGSNNHDGNINRVLEARVRYIDAIFDYLRIKVETWNSKLWLVLGLVICMLYLFYWIYILNAGFSR